MEINKLNIWQITTIVFAGLFLLAVFNVFSFGGSSSKITGNAVGYLNENILGPQGAKAIVISSEKLDNGLIKAMISIDGQPGEIYVSSDGKLLLTGAIPLTEESIEKIVGDSPAAGVLEVSAADSPFLGPEDAESVVVEFSDFECPFCGLAFSDELGKQRFGSSYEAAVPRLEQLAKEGKIKFVYRHFPLEFHENAMPSALASECANEQGKFWEYHDVLFMNQEALTVSDLKRYAVDLGLDANMFNTCLDSQKYLKKIQKDMADAQGYGVTGTPAFFVNGVLLSGSQPWSMFEPLLNL